jgi:hypothetical protein
MFALGDAVEKCLRFFGITEQKVSAVIKSKGCGCRKRKEALNNAGYFAQRFATKNTNRIFVAVYFLAMRIKHSRIGVSAMYLKIAFRILFFGMR